MGTAVTARGRRLARAALIYQNIVKPSPRECTCYTILMLAFPMFVKVSYLPEGAECSVYPPVPGRHVNDVS